MNNNYVIFEIEGIKHDNFSNSFKFSKDAECVIENDQIISKVVISSDISQATFYLHDTLDAAEDSAKQQIIKYLSLYLGNMMVSLLKNCLSYSNVTLKPTIRFSKMHLAGVKECVYKDYISLRDVAIAQSTIEGGSEILKNWIKEVEIESYESKLDKYDILFLLLKGNSKVQKYMAMYAYLMSLVKEIYSCPHESQKQVIQYISENCDRVGIETIFSHCTRPGARTDEMEDQFTAMRNKIAHPSSLNENVEISETFVNLLASIICCAIEDIHIS